jgi:hypothetical protein
MVQPQARVVYNRHGGPDEHTVWMSEEAADDLANEFGGMGVYDGVRIEFKPEET